jgi:hypothetical protein
MKQRIFIIAIISLNLLNVGAQNTIHKASKTIEYSFEDCKALLIQGEKATIKVSAKSQNTIELKITYIAKHKKQATAIRDLKHIRFDSQKEGSKLLLRNYYETANQKIESNLSFIYELIIPEEIFLDIRNLYGSINLQQLTGTKEIHISFGRLELENISGKTNIQLKYSDISTNNIAGQLTGSLSKSNVLINNCEANVSLNMSYGTLNASLLNNCKNFRINGERAEIQIQTPDKEYNMDIKTSFNKLFIFDENHDQQFRSTNKNFTKNIYIRTSYCPIKIHLK